MVDKYKVRHRVCLWCGKKLPKGSSPQRKFCNPTCKAMFHKAKIKGIKSLVQIHTGSAILVNPPPPKRKTDKSIVDMSIEEIIDYLCSRSDMPPSMKDTLLKAKLSGMMKQAKIREAPPELEVFDRDVEREILESREAKEFAEWLATKKTKNTVS